MSACRRRRQRRGAWAGPAAGAAAGAALSLILSQTWHRKSASNPVYPVGMIMAKACVNMEHAACNLAAV